VNDTSATLPVVSAQGQGRKHSDIQFGVFVFVWVIPCIALLALLAGAVWGLVHG
jgi:hypothetical protein